MQKVLGLPSCLGGPAGRGAHLCKQVWGSLDSLRWGELERAPPEVILQLVTLGRYVLL